jgi:hypothetical protein
MSVILQIISDVGLVPLDTLWTQAAVLGVTQHVKPVPVLAHPLA